MEIKKLEIAEKVTERSKRKIEKEYERRKERRGTIEEEDGD